MESSMLCSDMPGPSRINVGDPYLLRWHKIKIDEHTETELVIKSEIELFTIKFREVGLRNERVVKTHTQNVAVIYRLHRLYSDEKHRSIPIIFDTRSPNLQTLRNCSGACTIWRPAFSTIFLDYELWSIYRPMTQKDLHKVSTINRKAK